MIRRRFMVAVLVSGAVALAGGLLPASAAISPTAGMTGYDLSWPQCTSGGASAPAGSYPFAILGVNGGKANTPNTCIGAEVTNAQLANSSVVLSFYQNTGNPGTQNSTWRSETTPQVCSTKKPYTQAQLDCFSYDYGWNAAQYGFSRVSSAAASTAQWWLDIESANSWMSNSEANVHNITGAVDYLESKVGIGNVGIYTNSSSWNSITGGNTTDFSDLRWWAPGKVDSTYNPTQLASACSNTASLLGPGSTVRYLQWTTQFDMNYDCG